MVPLLVSPGLTHSWGYTTSEDWLAQGGLILVLAAAAGQEQGCLGPLHVDTHSLAGYMKSSVCSKKILFFLTALLRYG